VTQVGSLGNSALPVRRRAANNFLPLRCYRPLYGAALALLLLAGGLGACDTFENRSPNRVVVGDTTETMTIVGTLQYVEVEGGMLEP